MILIPFLAGCRPDNSRLVFVGTYTEKGSKGIYSFRFDPESAEITSPMLAASTDNPSFIVTDNTGNFLYAVNEINSFNNEETGSVSSYSINRETGNLTFLNAVSSLGTGPAHLSLDKTGKFILVANYGGGNVAVFRIEDDGSIGKLSAFRQHSGTGADTVRQRSPHAHFIQTTNDNRFVLVSDLGTDQIVVYRFDDTTGSLEPSASGSLLLEPGAGPRRFAFNPSGNIIYVLNELTSTVAVFDFDQRTAEFKPKQIITTLPENFTGKNTAAEIRIDDKGNFLYVSNRGDNSIVQFSIDNVSGNLRQVSRTSTKGNAPRHFEIDPSGRWLFVENQNTDNIVLFEIDQTSGNLTETGRTIVLSTPVCLRFLPKK